MVQQELETLFFSLNQEAEEHWQHGRIVNLESFNECDDEYLITLAIGKHNVTYHEIVCDQQGWRIERESESSDVLDDLMTYIVMPFLFPTHGGKRKGAGRKRENLVPITVRISPAVAAALKRKARESKTSQGKYLESIIRDILL